ncbi:MAG: cytochrome C oxidase subunit IV family protein [Melioribacteraceae bacterium]|nr:cytochrome C oxidase subunit IV family protein [Melioribacteraceae bacterium]
MEQGNTEHKEHSHGYGLYVLVWLGLIALTSITVTVAGVDFGNIALPIALFIAAIKSGLVINYFMHIKFEEPIFKVFLLLSGMTLLVIFILTFFDVFYR